MSTATILELKPDQRAWLDVRCEGGAWIAEDGHGIYSLRGGDDLLAVLRVCLERPKPEKGTLLVEVRKIHGGWLLAFGDATRVVHENDRSADRVLSDLKRMRTDAESLFARLENMAFAGDPRDTFSIPLTDEHVTRGQLRAFTTGARWLVRAAQAISLSPDTKDPNRGD